MQGNRSKLVFQFQFSISVYKVDTNGQKRAKKSQKKRTPTPQNETGGIIFISMLRYFFQNTVEKS